jgi:hypothetical protein
MHKPLIAFIPDIGHNARISYGGHEGSRSEDFLAHWFNEHGYPFLAISYPLEAESPMMPATWPSYSIADWTRQVSVTIVSLLQARQHPREVVILAWGMAGSLLQPVTTFLAEWQPTITVELFVSLAATPALPGLMPPISKRQLGKTGAGYASMSSFKSKIFSQLLEQDSLNKDNVTGNPPRCIIQPTIYQKEYTGATPIGIMGAGYCWDGNKKEFVEEKDKWQFMEDGKAYDYQNLPPMAAIYPISGLAFRHGITDRATWSFLITQRFMGKFFQNGTATAYLPTMESDLGNRFATARHRFRKLHDDVMNTPKELMAEIDGNHFFFVGEIGAKKTVEAVLELLERSRRAEIVFSGSA